MLHKVTAQGTCSERSEPRLCLRGAILISYLTQQLLQLDSFTAVMLQHRGHSKAVQQRPVLPAGFSSAWESFQQYQVSVVVEKPDCEALS